MRNYNNLQQDIKSQLGNIWLVVTFSFLGCYQIFYKKNTTL